MIWFWCAGHTLILVMGLIDLFWCWWSEMTSFLCAFCGRQGIRGKLWGSLWGYGSSGIQNVSPCVLGTSTVVLLIGVCRKYFASLKFCRRGWPTHTGDTAMLASSWRGRTSSKFRGGAEDWIISFSPLGAWFRSRGTSVILRIARVSSSSLVGLGIFYLQLVVVQGHRVGNIVYHRVRW